MLFPPLHASVFDLFEENHTLLLLCYQPPHWLTPAGSLATHGSFVSNAVLLSPLSQQTIPPFYNAYELDAHDNAPAKYTSIHIYNFRNEYAQH